MTRRNAGGVLAILIVLAGGAFLTVPTEASAFTDTCTSGSGSSCSGSTCCADATGCYTNPDICQQMYCDNHPNSPSCTHPN